MKAQTWDSKLPPYRLWLVNSITRTGFPIRLQRRTRLTKEMMLGPGDSDVVLPKIELKVCEAALVGRPFVSGASVPGMLSLLADGAEVWKGEIEEPSTDFRPSHRRDEVLFGASDSEDLQKELGVFVPNETIFKLCFRNVQAPIPVRVSLGVDLAVYTTAF